jgi:hypothetical protein
MGTQKRKRNVNDRSISNIKKVDGVLKKNTDIRNKLIILKETLNLKMFGSHIKKMNGF